MKKLHMGWNLDKELVRIKMAFNNNMSSGIGQ